MIWRFGAFAIIACVVIAGCASRPPQDITASWYPMQPGDTWIYQKMSLEGDMAQPDFERWITEETIVSAVPVRELAGTLVTRRTKVLDDTLTPHFLPENDLAKRELPETHLLIHQGCVYELDGWDATCAQVGDTCVPAFDQSHHVRREYRDELLRGKVPPGLCFPIVKGMTWGRVPSTRGSGLYVWDALALNADPFGPSAGKTYRLWSTAGAGESIDRWFAQGVGIVQQVIEHHGTYDEDRRQLLRATIHGKTQSYQLTPARIEPASEDDCDGPGWQHFSRADGSSFGSIADCISYKPHRN
jgi:hypothetical protein